MENDKYYGPNIEEFHVGFEYEIFEDWDVEKEKTWQKQVYGNDQRNPERLEYVGETMSKFRVKYLSKESIEELGFKDTKTVHGTVDIFSSKLNTPRGESIGLLYNYESNWCLIFAGEFEVTEWEEENNQFIINGNLFAGFIKNKSELKKILKMLEIK